jgi:hypothetical protein
MEDVLWSNAEGTLNVNADKIRFISKKESASILIENVSCISVTQKDNSAFFYAGFSVTLVGLVLLTLSMPPFLVYGVVFLGLILFFSSYVTRKRSIEISSLGSGIIECPMGKTSMEDLLSGMDIIEDAIRAKKKELQPDIEIDLSDFVEDEEEEGNEAEASEGAAEGTV